MLKLTNKKVPKATQKTVNFFDLSSGEQKRLIKEATKRANHDQLKIVKEYEKKFGDLQTNTCGQN